MRAPTPEERGDLNRVRVVARQAAFSELDHFETCPACGQAIDLRRLGDVLHHASEGHKALPLDA